MAESQLAFDYTAGNLREIEAALSGQRLANYVTGAGHDLERALHLYLWNARLSKAMRFPLEIAEVTVRSGINRALCDRWGANWPTDPAFRQLAAAKTLGKLDEARSKVGNSSSRIVGNVSFGFWTAILQARYVEELWRTRLGQFVPNLPAALSLEDKLTLLVDLLEKAITLRNRIGHLEPILRLDLSKHHADVRKLTGFVCKGTAAWMTHHSTLPRVLREGPNAVVKAGPVGSMMKPVPAALPPETPLTQALGEIERSPLRFVVVALADGPRFVTSSVVGDWLAAKRGEEIVDLTATTIGEIAETVPPSRRIRKNALVRDAIAALELRGERPTRFAVVS
ncbi:hypothetical protein [Aureimonas sp. AU22]|uniref:hypothetical protein n=1 Tax=Aureimonas sp. AU22 TaxID=1638162 RepID=UPI0007864741|nr:hypothetical protein [Aureimonas sp. AU22]